MGFLGMDVELYCWIFCLKNFVVEGKILREEIVILMRNLFKFNYYFFLLEGYIVCRLILLDKNLGVRLIGVGEVLCCIIGKIILVMFKEKIKEVVGLL